MTRKLLRVDPAAIERARARFSNKRRWAAADGVVAWLQPWFWIGFALFALHLIARAL